LDRHAAFLNDLDANAVRVELYADGISGGDPVRPIGLTIDASLMADDRGNR
jgi:hypothetical protein